MRDFVQAAFLHSVLQISLPRWDGAMQVNPTGQKREENISLATCAKTLLWTEVAKGLGFEGSEVDLQDRMSGDSSIFSKRAAAGSLAGAATEGQWETTDDPQDSLVTVAAAWLLAYGGGAQNDFTGNSLIGLFNRAVRQIAVSAGSGPRGLPESSIRALEIGLNLPLPEGTSEDAQQLRMSRRDMMRQEIKRVLSSSNSYPHDAKKSRIMCNDFLESRYNFSSKTVKIKRSGSIRHKTAVALSYDLDLVLEVPNLTTRASRRLWRMTHRRLQDLLSAQGAQELFGGSQNTSRFENESARCLPLPSLAFSSRVMTKNYPWLQERDELYWTVNDIAAFPQMRNNVPPPSTPKQLSAPSTPKQPPSTPKQLSLRAAQFVKCLPWSNNTKGSSSGRATAGGVGDQVRRDYLASPFLVDFRFSLPEEQDEQFLPLGPERRRWQAAMASGVQADRSSTKLLPGQWLPLPDGSTKFVPDGATKEEHQQHTTTPQVTKSTDDIIEFILLKKLNKNVRRFIQFTKRWVKERFPHRESAPLSGMSTTMFCFLYLWHLTGEQRFARDQQAVSYFAHHVQTGGSPSSGGRKPFGPITALRKEHEGAMAEFGKVLGVAREGVLLEEGGSSAEAMRKHRLQGSSPAAGARRGLLLDPKGKESGGFVLELFFGWLRFMVAEAELWHKCRKVGAPQWVNVFGEDRWCDSSVGRGSGLRRSRIGGSTFVLFVPRGTRGLEVISI